MLAAAAYENQRCNVLKQNLFHPSFSDNG